MDWGFDLTSFGSAEDFKKLLTKFGLKKYKKVPHATSYNKNEFSFNSFEWSGVGLKIVTGNNPLTGEYMNSKQRAPEKGYASYIGITGDADKVKALADYIRKIASIKDESKNRRDFI